MEWITATKIPVGKWAGDGVDWLTANAAWFFDGLASIVNGLISGILWALQTPPPLVVVDSRDSSDWSTPTRSVPRRPSPPGWRTPPCGRSNDGANTP